MIRISGRLHQSTLSYHEKHPILIPAKIRFRELLEKGAHKKVLHSGVADTLIQVREKYWVPKGRQIIKSIIRKCFVCKKFNSRPGMQIMAPLPRDRIERSPPFAVTRLDFARPIYVKNSKEKFYILLCTCAVTRALHLELDTSFTKAFLLAFRRFISRRRLCTVIYSDNAKKFKRAEILTLFGTLSASNEFIICILLHLFEIVVFNFSFSEIYYLLL
ncbi:integrase catalytic domain-containing protein [Trichonephila inaurata madagascariensis]|uniref:Integrase catalytic domain-containing protein n=1 Tax=Trichonephila inaurata madagascariensis TaxID=2747483 RepID=A0A8X7CL45_9ARAC|nr:integrase catalytic domain-containing protein [Trichonephila inaurata madagascariensis]